MEEILKPFNMHSCFYCKFGTYVEDVSKKLQLGLPIVYCRIEEEECYKDDVCDQWRYKF